MKDQVKLHDLSSALTEVENYKKGNTSGLQAMAFDEPIDVREVREHLNMTQEEFSKNFGVSLATLQGWEQGRRKPEGPAKLLLKIIMSKPNVVKEAVASFIKDRRHVHG